MPALNLPNAAEVSTPDLTGANGAQVNYSAFSGPTGSPLDAKQADRTKGTDDNTFPLPFIPNPDNYSTGALTTGIGFGCELNIGQVAGQTVPVSLRLSGFTDNYTPGTTLPDGTEITNTNTNPLYGAVLTCIGGGKSTANVNGIAPTVPYNLQPLLNMGNGGARNAGTGPAFTGFASKMVTAAADIAEGGVIETGFVNRTGAVLLATHSTDGSAVAASPAVV